MYQYLVFLSLARKGGFLRKILAESLNIKVKRGKEEKWNLDREIYIALFLLLYF